MITWVTYTDKYRDGCYVDGDESVRGFIEEIFNASGFFTAKIGEKGGKLYLVVRLEGGNR